MLSGVGVSLDDPDETRGARAGPIGLFPDDEMGARVARLTAGQLDCLRLVDRHLSSKEIAAELKISPHTVDQRVRQALATLGVERRTQAARLVAQHLGPQEGEYQRLIHRPPYVRGNRNRPTRSHGQRSNSARWPRREGRGRWFPNRAEARFIPVFPATAVRDEEQSPERDERWPAAILGRDHCNRFSVFGGNVSRRTGKFGAASQRLAAPGHRHLDIGRQHLRRETRRKGIVMRKQMIEAAALELATQVRTVEESIEGALAELAELQARMVHARSVTGAGFVNSHAPFEQLAAATTGIVAAGAASLSATRRSSRPARAFRACAPSRSAIMSVLRPKRQRVCASLPETVDPGPADARRMRDGPEPV